MGDVEDVVDYDNPYPQPHQRAAEEGNVTAGRFLLDDTERDEQQRVAKPLVFHPLFVKQRHQAQEGAEDQRHPHGPHGQRVEPGPPRDRTVVAPLVHRPHDFLVMRIEPLRQRFGKRLVVIARHGEIHTCRRPWQQQFDDPESHRRDHDTQHDVHEDKLFLPQDIGKQPFSQGNKSDQQHQ